MPKDKHGRDAGDLPSTVARSEQHAQDIWKETHDNAVEEYGEGERAHRTAFASLKHSYEKKGDHWERKDQRGPSDPRSTQSTADARRGVGETFGGIDYYGHTKKEFERRAQELGITGASHMRKRELVEAIEKREQAQTREAREKERSQGRRAA